MALPSHEEILAQLPETTLPKPTMYQTMGDKSFADYAPSNPAAVPAMIADGIKRISLLDVNGNIVPKKLQQEFLPDTSLSAGKPTRSQAIVQALPKGVQRLAETFLDSFNEGPMATLLPIVSRSTNKSVDLRASRLEAIGVPTKRAAELAFYSVFAEGTPSPGTPEYTRKQEAMRRLSALTPSSEEGHVLNISSLKESIGKGLDIGGIIFGPIEKQGLARAIQLAQGGGKEGVVPAIYNLLRRAGVEDNLAKQYAPAFAKSGPAEIEKGISSLDKMTSTSKVPLERSMAGFYENELRSFKPSELAAHEHLRLDVQDESTLEDVFVGDFEKKVSGEPFTVYRVVPKGAGISPGDFVFDNKQFADDFLKKYGKERGLAEVKTMRVTKSDLLLPEHWEGGTTEGEFIYAPKGTAPKPALSDSEARAFVKTNFNDLKPSYLDVVKKQYAGADNVISGDAAKQVIAGYEGHLAPVYHEASSDFAKALYAEWLPERQGLGNNTVLFTGGATGVGKTSALRTVGTKLGDYPIVYDTNLTGESALQKIQMALDNGYDIDIFVTHRDPLVSFNEGVIPRVKKENRIIDIAEHVSRHGEYAKDASGEIKAVSAIERRFKPYFDDGRIQLRHVDNTGARGEAKFSTIDALPKFEYSNLNERLTEATQAAVRDGKITETQGAAITGRSDRANAGRRIEQSDAGGKRVIEDKIPLPKTLSEFTHERTQLVRDISQEKKWIGVSERLKDAYPKLSQNIINVFARKLAGLSKTSDIEPILSTMQRLANQADADGQKILDRTMSESVRGVFSPKEMEHNIDLLARRLSVTDEEGRKLAAAAQNEYDQMWEEFDPKVIDRFNEANIERGMLEDIIADHPGKAFTQFRLPGETYGDMDLAESLARGIRTGGKNSTIDQYLTENGFTDLAEAEESMRDYIALKKRLNDLKKEIRELRPQARLSQILRGVLEGLPVVTNKEAARIDDLVNSATFRDFTDISGFKGQWRDLDRNFEQFFGRYYRVAKQVFLDTFDEGKRLFVDNLNAGRQNFKKNVSEKYNIARGSEESAAIQDWGERELMASPATANPDSIYHTTEALVAKFGEKRAQEIQEAAAWFRPTYDKSIEEANAVLKQIYPNDPSKLIPYRRDYFHHFEDFGDGFLDAIRNFMDVPSGIDPKLIGLSEWTKPKQKFKAFAQERKGPRSNRDAVEGYLRFQEALEYLKAIEPHISRFRYLRRKLAEVAPRSGTKNAAGVKEVGADNFLQFLDDFSNDLAGKTAAADRYIQRVIPGGRATMRGLDFVLNRIKGNTMLANQGTTLAQLANIPSVIAETKQHAARGMIRTAAGFFDPAAPSRNSTFLRERFQKTYKYEFPIDFAKHPFKRSEEEAAKVFAWMLRSGDQIGSEFAWNSFYEKYLAENRSVKNGVEIWKGSASPDAAMLYADQHTRRLVAGRGVGELSLAQKARMVQMSMPFTIETNNMWYWLADRVRAKDFGGLAAFLLLNYAYNETMERVRGSRVSWDPINAILEGSDLLMREIQAGHPVRGATKFAGRQVGEVMTNLGGGQILTSVLPDTIFGMEKKDLFGQGDPNRFGPPLLFAGAMQSPIDFVTRVVTPFGGVQLKKTYEGVRAIMDGEVRSKNTGKVSYPVARTPENILRAILFGPNATSEAHDSHNAGDKLYDLIKTQDRDRLELSMTAEKTWADLHAMDKTSAQAKWKELSKSNPQLIAKMNEISKEEEKGLTAKDRLILQLGVSNGARARYIVDQIESLKTKEERQALWKEYVKKKILTPEVQKQADALLAKEL